MKIIPEALDPCHDMTQAKDEDDMGIHKGNKCQMINDRDKRVKDLDDGFKGIPEGTCNILNSRKEDCMKGEMKQKECIKLVVTERERQSWT